MDPRKCKSSRPQVLFKKAYPKALHYFLTFYLNSNIWDGIFTPKASGVFWECTWGKKEMVQILFYSVLFCDMKQKYFVSDMKYFVVMDIYFFIYSVLGEETFILCST